MSVSANVNFPTLQRDCLSPGVAGFPHPTADLILMPSYLTGQKYCHSLFCIWFFSLMFDSWLSLGDVVRAVT